MIDRGTERAVELGQYIIKTGATVRAAARIFHISKSTVHKDISERLKKIDPPLYRKVKKIMDKNRAERHIRGGDATRRKYLVKKSLPE
ncbi:MAG: sporulation transcriptional regulator SpoIIID [Oscillospiraceae bacterium]|nr:sporulation transcriptional regulator SpoIIID [Oscillospiraceae bacterium]